MDRKNFVLKKVICDKSLMRFNFAKAEKYSMYEYKKSTYIIKETFVSFNFVKHWPIRNLFNVKILPINGNMFEDVILA